MKRDTIDRINLLLATDLELKDAHLKNSIRNTTCTNNTTVSKSLEDYARALRAKEDFDDYCDSLMEFDGEMVEADRSR